MLTAESHVVDVAISDIGSGPGLESRSELAVQHPDILDNHVFND